VVTAHGRDKLVIPSGGATGWASRISECDRFFISLRTVSTGWAFLSPPIPAQQTPYKEPPLPPFCSSLRTHSSNESYSVETHELRATTPSDSSSAFFIGGLRLGLGQAYWGSLNTISRCPLGIFVLAQRNVAYSASRARMTSRSSRYMWNSRVVDATSATLTPWSDRG